MKIEFARSDDYESICTLLDDFNLPHEDIKLNDLNHFLVARKDENLIGAVGLELFDQVALLRSLVIQKNIQRVGLGRKLTKHIEKYAASRDVKVIYLLTTAAEHFFSQFGYTIVDREVVPEEIKLTAEYKYLCPSSALTMVKHIHDT
jgi:amino-acid N-acetyltransferase